MRWIRALLAVVTIAAVAASVAVLATGVAGTDLGTLWHDWAPGGLNLMQAVVQRYIHPLLWSHVLLPVLLTPSLVVFAVLGTVTLLLWLLAWRFAGSA